MQKSISRLRNIFYHSSSRSRTKKVNSVKFKSNNSENVDPDSNFIDHKIWLTKSVKQSKKLLNKTTNQNSSFNSSPFKNIALRHHLEINRPQTNFFWKPQEIQKAKIPIRNVAYANIIKNNHNLKNKNKNNYSSDLSEVGIDLNKKRSAFSLLNNNSYNYRNLNSFFIINDHDPDFRASLSKKVNPLHSYINFSPIKKSQASIPSNEEKDEQIVFKINPYIDSSSKYILNTFQNQYFDYMKKKSGVNLNKQYNIECIIRKMIPILFLKFPENKTFFRKMINYPINEAKSKALNEKLENNRKNFNQKRNKTVVNSRKNMFVKIKKKEAANGNDHYKHLYTRTQNNFNKFSKLPKNSETNGE